MFLASLEMDLDGLQRNKYRALVFGLLTFAIPFAMNYVTGISLLGYTTGAALLLACIMSSHTLISYPIVSRYGLQRKPSVVISVGATMVSLLLALIVLAVIVASHQGGGGFAFWSFFILKMALYCAVLLYVVPG